MKNEYRHLNTVNEIFPQDENGYEYSYINSVNKINKIDPTDISGDKTVGKTINKIQENNERNIKTILNLIDSDIYTKENSSNTFNNYFENAGVPCYKNVPFTNMVIPLLYQI